MNLKYAERLIWLALGCAAVVIAYEIFGTDAVLKEFSPDTLELRSQNIKSSLHGVALFERPHAKMESRVVNYLVAKGYVAPVAARQPARWLHLGTFSSEWRDGQGPLIYAISWSSDATIAWSEADPQRARLFWATVFRLIRSDNPAEVRAGQAIAQSLVRRDVSPEELQQWMDEILKGYLQAAKP